MTVKTSIRFSASLLLALVLVGCSSEPAAPAPAAAAEKRNDGQITEDVLSRLKKDSNLKDRPITVRADSGTVILTGTVASKEQFGAAQVIADGTPGVKHIINRLIVQQQEQPPQP